METILKCSRILFLACLLLAFSCRPTQTMRYQTSVKDSTIITRRDSLVLLPRSEASKALSDSLWDAIRKLKPNERIVYRQDKAELSFWRDEYGKLMAQCAAKEDSIRLIYTKIERLLKEQSEKTEAAVRQPRDWLRWEVVALAFIALIFFLAILRALKT